VLQAVGQLTYIRPYVTDFSPEWLFGSSMSLVAGSMALIYVAGTDTGQDSGEGVPLQVQGLGSLQPHPVGILQHMSEHPYCKCRKQSLRHPAVAQGTFQ
jgi:hypothetical protein